jgi:hypothetical protein
MHRYPPVHDNSTKCLLQIQTRNNKLSGKLLICYGNVNNLDLLVTAMSYYPAHTANNSSTDFDVDFESKIIYVNLL